MENLDGVAKLGDVLQHLDLVHLASIGSKLGSIELDIYLADDQKHVLRTSGWIDHKTWEIWVQLPLSLQDAIVCQARPQPAERKLDRRVSSNHANPRAVGLKEPTAPAQRRATACPQCSQPIIPLTSITAGWLDWTCEHCSFRSAGKAEDGPPWLVKADPWPDDVVSATLKTLADELVP